MTKLEAMTAKLKQCASTVAVVGLGYVGMPLLRKALDAGFDVIGIDTNHTLVTELQSAVYDWTQEPIDRGRLRVYGSKNWPEVSRADIVVICVPTPITDDRAPDMSAVKAVVGKLHTVGRPHQQLVILESTVYPGATADLFAEPRGRMIAYSPERIDPGNHDDPGAITKVVGSPCPETLELAQLFYEMLGVTTVGTDSWEAAESAKLLENIYRCVNIALVNEMKIIFTKMGIDIWEVIRLAKTKPFGFQPFYPGPGMGGHCIPVDPFYLSWAARRVGEDALFIERAGQINNRMPNYVAGRIMRHLNDVGKCMKGSKILLLGVAYKKGVADIRNSPTLALSPLLRRAGAEVTLADPYITQYWEHGIDYSKYDCAVVMTDHEEFPWVKIRNESQMVIDTRGVYEDEIVRQA